MHILFKTYLEWFERLHALVVESVRDLPPTALDWQPGPDMNSLAVLLAHTAGAEKYWVCAVAGGDDHDRDRAAEFRTAGATIDDLLAQLDDTLTAVRATLAALQMDDLAQVREAGRNGEAHTVSWALMHALEHTSLHLGHIHMTRQLWEQAQAD